MEIGEWLRSLGLERYEQAFRDNEIDGQVLPKLTADDLTGLGIVLIGHRRKLLAPALDSGAARNQDAELGPKASRFHVQRHL